MWGKMYGVIECLKFFEENYDKRDVYELFNLLIIVYCVIICIIMK